MSNAPAPDPVREARLDQMAHDVFSSEKREDIWAIAIALVLLILCILMKQAGGMAFLIGTLVSVAKMALGLGAVWLIGTELLRVTGGG